MKAIILAAGHGERLRPYTNDRPKCMVSISGRPIIEHQLKVLHSQGIEEIHVVAGYHHETVDYLQLNKWVNPEYANTNMVYSLMQGASCLDGKNDVLICYGDIVFEERVVGAILATRGDIVLGIDKEWRKYWEARMENPLADAETLKLMNGNQIRELGKKPNDYSEIQGQYMGLIKVKSSCQKEMVRIWNQLKEGEEFDGRLKNKMFMTSFIQYLIDLGWDVRAAFVENGWLEIDSPDDLEMVGKGFWKAGI